LVVVRFFRIGDGNYSRAGFRRAQIVFSLVICDAIAPFPGSEKSSDMLD